MQLAPVGRYAGIGAVHTACVVVCGARSCFWQDVDPEAGIARLLCRWHPDGWHHGARMGWVSKCMADGRPILLRLGETAAVSAGVRESPRPPGTQPAL